MVDLFLATCRENKQTGYAALLIEDGNLSDKSTAIGQIDTASTKIFKAVLSKIPADKNVTFHILREDRLLDEKKKETLWNAMSDRGHPSVGLIVSSEDDPSLEEEGVYDDYEILVDLSKKARAAAWKVRLNPNAFVPGPSISTQKAQHLHQLAHRSGFTRGGLRLFLSEYGMISTKEITSAIYDKVRNRLGSETVAEIYNEKYQEQTGQLPADA